MANLENTLISEGYLFVNPSNKFGFLNCTFDGVHISVSGKFKMHMFEDCYFRGCLISIPSESQGVFKNCKTDSAMSEIH